MYTDSPDGTYVADGVSTLINAAEFKKAETILRGMLKAAGVKAKHTLPLMRDIFFRLPFAKGMPDMRMKNVDGVWHTYIKSDNAWMEYANGTFNNVPESVVTYDVLGLNELE